MRHYIPQAIMAALLLYQLLRDIERHGKRRQTTDNGLVTLIAVVLNVALLWWGGFWK